ncbi:MAG TPA: ArsR family transcriptional regulator [Candidatus Thermoplasmatota archaeon]|nr:ArsR family transcriptional regulator [Candidatus Thermoplasmatota archaeon]
MTDERTPEGAVRRRVYRLVLNYPGVHLRGAEQQLGISSALASYHLNELEKGQWVRSYEMEGYRRWFPGPRSREAALTRRERRMLGLLREQAALQVTLLLLERGELAHKDLVEELGLAKSTVSYHLAKMEGAGLLKRVEDRIVLADADLAESLLLRFEPTPDLMGRFRKLWEDLYG